jgi:hypothetical protein
MGAPEVVVGEWLVGLLDLGAPVEEVVLPVDVVWSGPAAPAVVAVFVVVVLDVVAPDAGRAGRL